MKTEQRISVIEKKLSVINKKVTVFVPQFRRVFLWGILKSFWRDYTYDYGDDILLGLDPTSYEFKTRDDAVQFLINN